jgi:hypothetical protein
MNLNTISFTLVGKANQKQQWSIHKYIADLYLCKMACLNIGSYENGTLYNKIRQMSQGEQLTHLVLIVCKV